MQKLERVLDGSDVLEALVDKRLPVRVSVSSQGFVRQFSRVFSPRIVTTGLRRLERENVVIIIAIRAAKQACLNWKNNISVEHTW